MEMKDLFFFDSRYLSASVQVIPTELDGNRHCTLDESNLILAKYEGINFPVSFKQTLGKKFTDILTTGYVSLFLISDKLKNLLIENHITGWKTYLIILEDKKGNLIEGYHGFSIVGISGQKSYVNSQIIETRYVPEGPIVRLYKGANIDLTKWDGCDFFVPESSVGIVVTRKVAELLERNSISNLSLINVAEVERSVKIWDKVAERADEKRNSK